VQLRALSLWRRFDIHQGVGSACFLLRRPEFHEQRIAAELLLLQIFEPLEKFSQGSPAHGALCV
jgi:hypothetical protein